jgi:small subunit ribosomal protein S9
MPIEKKEEKKANEKYFQGIGRRKRSTARIKLFASAKKTEKSGDPDIVINGKSQKTYFSLAELQEIVVAPIRAVSGASISKISVSVRGGGIRGQAEAIRLGVSRAMVLLDEESKKTLKDLGYLTRDARKVERKKAGLKKARRAPQFSKR